MHDVDAAEQAVVAAREALTPSLFLGVNGSYAERFSASAQGVTRNSSRSLNGEMGVRATTSIGTSIEVAASNGVSWSTSNINVATTESVTFGPNYTAELAATIRQPVLAGAGEDVVLAPTRQAESNRKATEVQRDEAASGVVRDVLQAYWELWYAERALGVQVQARSLAKQQHREARTSADTLGNVAETDVLRFDMEVASADETVAQARATRAARAVALGRLLSMKPAASMKLVAAAEAPEVQRLPTLNVLLQQAESASYALKTLDAQIDAARHSLSAAEDGEQPQLDFVLGLSMGGVWTSSTITSLTLPGGRPAFAASLGLELELPLGPGVASAQASQARSQLAAARARYDAEAESLAADVAALAIDVEQAEAALVLTEKSARLSHRLAEAERQRYALGTTTPQEVVRAQQTAREAALRRLRAMADHAVAVTSLEHRTARLIPKFAVRLPETP